MASCITALRLCLGRAPRRSDNTSDPGSAQFHNDKPGVHIDAGYHPPPCLETPLALSLFAPSNPPHEHEGPVTSYLVTWPRLFKALFGFIRGIPRDEDDEREPLLREKGVFDINHRPSSSSPPTPPPSPVSSNLVRENRIPANFSALWEAARDGETVLVEQLLKSNSFEIEWKDIIGGMTPLAIASVGGHVEIVKLLLQAGADINARDTYMLTPLILAIRFRKLLVVYALLADGSADLTCHDRFGRTALHFTVDWELPSVVTKLLREGADITVRDSQGQTVLDKAKGQITLTKALLENAPAKQDVIDCARRLFAAAMDDGDCAEAILLQSYLDLHPQHFC